MKTVRKTLALVLTVLPIACSTSEVAVVDPPRDLCSLWRVSSATTTVDLLGSVHALTEDLSVLPPAMEASFDQASRVFFEVDIGDLEAEALTMLAKGSLGGGRTIDQVISPEAFGLVEARFAEAGLPMAGFEGMKPWMLALTLMSFEMLKAGFDPEQGVDVNLYRRAKAEGKTIDALETVDFQLSLFDDMPMDQQEQFLVYTLNELDEAIPLLEEIAGLWRTGQGDELARLLHDGFDEFPELERRIVTDRNHTWIPEIEAALAGNEPTVFVVGALHLVGDEGLVEILRGKGYEVEQR